MCNFPNYIHQYANIGKAKELLESLKLRLDEPSAFNDPFEFLPKTKLTKEIIFNDNNVKPSKILWDAFSSSPVELIAQLPETFEKLAQINLVKKCKQIINEYRICCFSEIDDSILMWGHYSRQHTGVVITFSAAMDYWEHNLCKVNYSPKRVSVSLLDSIFTDNDTIVDEQWQRDLLVTKSEQWSYEREWRFIKNKNKCPQDEKGTSYMPIDRKAIKSIILGCRISKENREYMINMAKNWKDVSVYQSIPDNKKYLMRKKLI